MVLAQHRDCECPCRLLDRPKILRSHGKSIALRRRHRSPVRLYGHISMFLRFLYRSGDVREEDVLTLHSFIALELLCRAWSRNATTAKTVDKYTTVRVGCKGEICDRNTAISDSQLTVWKLVHDSESMAFDPGSKNEFVRHGNGARCCGKVSLSCMSARKYGRAPRCQLFVCALSIQLSRVTHRYQRPGVQWRTPSLRQSRRRGSSRASRQLILWLLSNIEHCIQ